MIEGVSGRSSTPLKSNISSLDCSLASEEESTRSTWLILSALGPEPLSAELIPLVEFIIPWAELKPP